MQVATSRVTLKKEGGFAMRATQHSGRYNKKGKGFSPRHNDRYFNLELSDHIDVTRINDNIYYNLYDGTYNESMKDGKLSFDAAEKRFYTEVFYDQWQHTQQTYRNNRHASRCKSFEDWCSKNAPEEVILQIGDTDESVSKEDFKACVVEYNKHLKAWSEAHGEPFKILSIGIHNDEAVPHAHLRRVWVADKNGLKTVGQNKALIQAGVELPNPDKPEGRYNNRKQTFDAEMRAKWLDICEAHGFKVEREALPDGKHNRTKEQLIRDKYTEMLDFADRMEVEKLEFVSRKQKLDEREKSLDALQSDLKAQEDVLRDKEAQLDAERLKIDSRASETLRRGKELDEREERLNKRERALEASEHVDRTVSGGYSNVSNRRLPAGWDCEK